MQIFSFMCSQHNELISTHIMLTKIFQIKIKFHQISNVFYLLFSKHHIYQEAM